jgi:hypothetical protein
MRSQFYSIISPTFPSIQKFAHITQRYKVEYTQLDSLAQGHQTQEPNPDSITLNLPYGGKRSDASKKASQISLLSKTPQGLYTTDYEQCLEACEWQDIVSTLQQSSMLMLSAVRKREQEYLSLPTPTTLTNVTKKRPPGTNKLEQNLKLSKGKKLNPDVCRWMMGFPVGWVEDILIPSGENYPNGKCPAIPQNEEKQLPSTPEVSAQPKPDLPGNDCNIYGTSKTKRGRSGSITAYLEHKKVNGVVVSYPRISNRSPEIWNHWRWLYTYQIILDGSWVGRSINVPVAIAPTVKKMIEEKSPVQEIAEFILNHKKQKRRVPKIK